MGYILKKALIIIDMQNDFVSGVLGTAKAKAIVPDIVEKVKEEQQKNTDCFFLLDTHEENYLETQEGKKLPTPHCIRGTKGQLLIEELAPFVKTAPIEKTAFASLLLPQKVEKYDELELIGLCTDICVLSNAILLKAHFPEKEIIVNADLCAGTTAKFHRDALSLMEHCQITIHSAGKISQKKPEITVNTFGNFEVFVNNRPIKFSRSKSKELLAFLIDRQGAGITNAEIASILYEDKGYNRSVKNQVQTVISGLLTDLRNEGIEDMIIRQWNHIAVDTSRFQCDYYDFLNKKKSAVNKFAGEYMSNYSWAEWTTGYLIDNHK